MNFPIYSGIEVPKARQAGRSNKYPLADMQVGQCFFIEPKEGEEIAAVMRRACGSTQRFRSMNDGWKFSVRVTQHPDTNQMVVGVWRTA